MEPDRVLLSAIALLQAAGYAERWLRRREARETELETQASAPRSLSVRIDEVAAEQAAQRETVGRLGDTVAEFNEAASRRHSDLQVRIGEMDVSLRLRFQTYDRDVRELREVVARVERGQSEWMRALRHRTHAIANHVNKIIVRLAMSERGVSVDRLPELKPVELDSTSIVPGDSDTEGPQS